MNGEKSILSTIVTALAAFLSIPCLLIIVSWNALPGEKLYSVKTGLEDIPLSLLGKTALASNFSVKYTERRYDEAIVLLDKKGSTAGYELLIAEAKESKERVIKTSDKKNAEELLSKINEYQENIEKKKSEIQSGQSSVPVRKNTASSDAETETAQNRVSNTVNPKNKSKEDNTTQDTTTVSDPVKTQKPAPTPTEAPVVTSAQGEDIVVEQAESNEEVITDLEQTQDELEEIKKEIETKIPQSFYWGTKGNWKNNQNKFKDNNSQNSNNMESEVE